MVNKMNRHFKKRIILILGICLVAVLAFHFMFTNSTAKSQSKADHLYQQNLAVSKTSSTTKKITHTVSKNSQTSQSSAPSNINWRKSSETKPYPNLKQYPQAWLDVNIAKQRVYVRDGANHNQILYTMYCSTDKNNGTPRGTYQIQAERGTHFYNPAVKEGANYYVSWLNHGEYLFHTVPVNANNQYIKSQAVKLSKQANSHGCIQLSVPDAMWVYNNVPFGMKVVIH
ncbi:hypothetical protein FD16_GL001500 [Paucilactobacillus suebicus DSM 5007 = KCTC 3549]|uniref:L,D-TPase catalytic domain-containing protein n=2 Tax=Paucilactobacillus suebicus TaxID=152335 RepID=A0A0R1VWQ4_9LACO|nr:hypothetical protein FD16_GL001500 [Paucilactobacillus suebicus DSM 5007 = KCTC 3549]